MATKLDAYKLNKGHDVRRYILHRRDNSKGQVWRYAQYAPSSVARHRPMPLADRAMQFGAFAAVTGHGDAVKQSELQAELNAETVYDDEWD